MVIDQSLNAFAERVEARFNPARPAGAPTTRPTPADRSTSDPVRTAAPANTSFTSLLTQPSYGPPRTTTATPAAADRSENRMHAIGLANVGRTNVETLNFGASIYNGAKKEMEDPKVQAQIRKYGELLAQRDGVDADAYYEQVMGSFRKSMDWGLTMMKNATGNMKMNFDVTGRPVTKDATGFYRTGDYTQSASGAGWSVRVNSRGEATAIANGVDVSAQVDGSRSEGFRWSDIGRAGQAISIAA